VAKGPNAEQEIMEQYALAQVDLLEILLLPVVLIETVDLTEIVALISDATQMLSEPHVIRDSSKTSFQLCIKHETIRKYRKYKCYKYFFNEYQYKKLLS
jgi:hypothetical protein